VLIPRVDGGFSGKMYTHLWFIANCSFPLWILFFQDLSRKLGYYQGESYLCHCNFHTLELNFATKDEKVQVNCKFLRQIKLTMKERIT
jgi:competence CoiA-like predicted nuclease